MHKKHLLKDSRLYPPCEPPTAVTFTCSTYTHRAMHLLFSKPREVCNPPSLHGAVESAAFLRGERRSREKRRFGRPLAPPGRGGRVRPGSPSQTLRLAAHATTTRDSHRIHTAQLPLSAASTPPCLSLQSGFVPGPRAASPAAFPGLKRLRYLTFLSSTGSSPKKTTKTEQTSGQRRQYLVRRRFPSCWKGHFPGKCGEVEQDSTERVAGEEAEGLLAALFPRGGSPSTQLPVPLLMQELFVRRQRPHPALAPLPESPAAARWRCRSFAVLRLLVTFFLHDFPSALLLSCTEHAVFLTLLRAISYVLKLSQDCHSACAIVLAVRMAAAQACPWDQSFQSSEVNEE